MEKFKAKPDDLLPKVATETLKKGGVPEFKANEVKTWNDLNVLSVSIKPVKNCIDESENKTELWKCFATMNYSVEPEKKAKSKKSSAKAKAKDDVDKEYKQLCSMNSIMGLMRSANKTFDPNLTPEQLEKNKETMLQSTLSRLKICTEDDRGILIKPVSPSYDKMMANYNARLVNKSNLEDCKTRKDIVDQIPADLKIELSDKQQEAVRKKLVNQLTTALCRIEKVKKQIPNF